ncbi:MAG: phage tail assembly chaperone [Alphaproteobacteria bacterium]|nr:phage tail assembly chaperone [Alphaproteobacteria bacterium]
MTIFYEKKNGKIIRWTQSEQQAVLEKMQEQCTDEDLVATEDGDYYLRGEVPNVPKERKAERIRAKRNRLLSESDWTQTLDVPLTAEDREEWALYRQELRDITKQASFPHSVVWPEME